jgi:ComF family protein
MPVANRVGRLLLDLVLPPLCLRCGTVVDEPQALCAACWGAITFLSSPCCETCGVPFPHPLPDGSRCAGCLQRRPHFDRARSAFVYDDASRLLVVGFKNADRIDATRAYAAWLVRAGGSDLRRVDLIVPVPLHRYRLWRRRYNQSALLAQAVARQVGIPYRPDVLVRRRATPSQGGLSRAARARNVRAAFWVPRPARTEISGQAVALIDDVFTTGATVEECARTLRAAGARSVFVLTLARVIRDLPG